MIGLCAAPVASLASTVVRLLAERLTPLRDKVSIPPTLSRHREDFSRHEPPSHPPPAAVGTSGLSLAPNSTNNTHHGA